MLNEALIDKWTWRFAMEMQGLWKSVIVGKFREEAGEMQFMREDMD